MGRREDRSRSIRKRIGYQYAQVVTVCVVVEVLLPDRVDHICRTLATAILKEELSFWLGEFQQVVVAAAAAKEAKEAKEAKPFSYSGVKYMHLSVHHLLAS